ncbi:transposase [Streptomyces sp. NPDC059866]|uniref:IS701 family transposase n=1 Tax=Streptomyces sp. NPDC059866 TaxID=3346978 RepID=UPI0036617404
MNARRLGRLLGDERTTPHAGGVLVIDDSGDRKDGGATANVGRQWLGRYGKTDNAVVTVTTLWADENLYHPLHAVPYTPAHHFAKGRTGPGFRTKWRIAAQLARQACAAGFPFRAAVADGAYRDVDDFRCELHAADIPFVMAVRRRRGTWAYGNQAHTPIDAARELAWHGPDRPGEWTPVTRTFRDGHTATRWAADATLGFWGPDALNRLVVATTDPATLPDKSTWYLVTDLPRLGSTRADQSPYPPADLEEVVRIYGIRNWIEQSYKQVKDELGWADFQVRTDRAIRRHQTLVNCAFSFCWETGLPPAAANPPGTERGDLNTPTGPLAPDSSHSPQLADPRHHAATLVESLVQHAPTQTTTRPDQRRQPRPTAQPLPGPALTNHRQQRFAPPS